MITGCSETHNRIDDHFWRIADDGPYDEAALTETAGKLREIGTADHKAAIVEDIPSVLCSRYYGCGHGVRELT